MASGSMTDYMIMLEGETSIIGRSVMIHAAEDAVGQSSGARVACGKIVSN